MAAIFMASGASSLGPMAGHDYKFVSLDTVAVHPLVTLKAAQQQTCEVVASTRDG